MAKKMVGFIAAGFVDGMHAAAEKLNAWREQMKEEEARKVRNRARANLVSDFVNLRDRTKVYASALRDEVGSLEEMIAKAEAEATAFYAKADADKPTTPEAVVVKEETAPVELEAVEKSATAVTADPETKQEPVALKRPERTQEAIIKMLRPELRKIAAELRIKGHSRMTLDELRVAILMDQEAKQAA